MIGQAYLKEQRRRLNLSITAVALQTSLKESLINECEDQTKKLDPAAYFILEDHYQQQLKSQVVPQECPSYKKWLDSLKVGDQVLLKERTIGIADSFKYRLDSIRELKPDQIILRTGLEIKRDSGALDYHTPTGGFFYYKIFPASDQIERDKKLSFLEQAVMLYSSVDFY